MFNIREVDCVVDLVRVFAHSDFGMISISFVPRSFRMVDGEATWPRRTVSQ